MPYSVTRICSNKILTISSPRLTLSRLREWLPACLTESCWMSNSSKECNVEIEFDALDRSSTWLHIPKRRIKQKMMLLQMKRRIAMNLNWQFGMTYRPTTHNTNDPFILKKLKLKVNTWFLVEVEFPKMHLFTSKLWCN